METRKLLVDGVAVIAALSLDKAGSDAAGAAFNTFRKGVVHASSGRTGSPEMLLADLEPKGHVLTFLVEFHIARRIFRKQVGGVLGELLRIDSWFFTLRNDRDLRLRLPVELASLLAEREEEEKEDVEADAWADVEEAACVIEPATPPFPSLASPPALSSPPALTRADEAAGPWVPVHLQSPSFSHMSVSSPENSNSLLDQSRRPKLAHIKAEIRKAAAGNKMALPIRVAGPTATGHYAPGNVRATASEQDTLLNLLESGRKQIQSLDFSAADKDPAVSAFETFRRAVQQVVNSAVSKQDDNPVECVEPKGKILEFLVDMYERHQKYRSRVTSTLTCLLNFDGWRHAAESDASVHAAVHDFQDTKSMSVVTSDGRVGINVKSAAAAAVARGGVGAVYIQIIAGYNLMIADSNGSSDPYVRVRLGGRTQRTHIINDCLNPKWNANPFIFEVPSRNTSLKFECLDSDFVKDDPLGELEITIAEVSTDPELSTMRRALLNVAHGELEFKILYVPADLERELKERDLEREQREREISEQRELEELEQKQKEELELQREQEELEQKQKEELELAAQEAKSMPAEGSELAAQDLSEIAPQAAGVDTGSQSTAGASALWTPWGPAAPVELASSRTEPRHRAQVAGASVSAQLPREPGGRRSDRLSSNPFERNCQVMQPDSPQKQSGYPGAVESLQDPPTSARSAQGAKPNSSPESDSAQVPVRTRAAASMYDSSTPQVFKPTNPFADAASGPQTSSADAQKRGSLRCETAPAGINPFAQDSRPAGSNSTTPRKSLNPFL